jgi:hypothetical protein
LVFVLGAAFLRAGFDRDFAATLRFDVLRVARFFPAFAADFALAFFAIVSPRIPQALQLRA